MKHYYNLSILLFSFTLCTFTNAFGQELTSDKISQVESLIAKKMTEDGIPGMSIAIVVNGKLNWSNGYGTADLENMVPARPSSAYRSASVGKSITATAVMRLVERGLIDLDVPIQEYCDVFPEKRYPITTRHLLSHTSGIRHYGGPNHEAEMVSARHYKNVIDPLNIFKEDSLLFKPGSQFLYSTYGYNLLGCVIEKASGMKFIDYLDKYIFEPAGMMSTEIDNPFKIIPHRAGGYMYDDNSKLQNAPHVDMSNKVPAGGYITTAEDLAKFAAAFMNYELVQKSTAELMLTPQKTADDEVIEIGLGWGLFPGEKWYGEREAFHGGITPGVSSMLYLLPDRKFAIAMQMNLQGVSGRTQLSAEIAKIVLELDQ